MVLLKTSLSPSRTREPPFERYYKLFKQSSIEAIEATRLLVCQLETPASPRCSQFTV